jgi:hypothetical protein
MSNPKKLPDHHAKQIDPDLSGPTGATLRAFPTFSLTGMVGNLWQYMH